MIGLKKWYKFPRGLSRCVLVIIVYICASAVIRAFVPAPQAVGMSSPERPIADIRFFNDSSWLDEGARYLSQNVFDGIFDGIRAANNLIVLDMFLFNQWQGPAPENHRALSSELTQVLIEQQHRYPDMDIIVISDPINTVYGGLPSVHFDEMKSAGIHVLLTRLDQLQDSNPLWSGVWRGLIKPWGNEPGDILPNPFGDGRVSIRSYLALLNFKANHRKLMIADNQGSELYGWVSSANPHDGSSAHRNIGIRFSGEAVLDLLNSERALLSMNDADHLVALLDKRLEALAKSGIRLSLTEGPVSAGAEKIQLVSESSIHKAVLAAITRTRPGDRIDMAMFYLSEREIIAALKKAAANGVQVRVLLDVNSDAFGRSKNGVPNRPVAAELVKASVVVRWCLTEGEQCHAKWLHVRNAEGHEFFVGSANFTGRNLLDLNMETDVRLVLHSDNSMTKEMHEFFERQWSNADGRGYSAAYDEFADDSLWLTLQYRFMEMSGLSTF
jgi:hypothetical protein